MLVRIARQSHLGDPEGCAAILNMLATSRLVRGHLHSVLQHLGLTEAKLATLVTLYALDPEPASPADLSVQTQVSRASMTELIETLHARSWITRKPSPSDRRTQHLRLTEKGRTFVESAVRPFLIAVGHCADVLTPAEYHLITQTCARLCTHLKTA